MDISLSKRLTMRGHLAPVSSVAFSPDGKHALSGSEDQTLKLWDATNGNLIRTFEGHTFWVSSVAFSPDGAHLLSGSADKTLKLWDATFEGPSAPVRSVAFSPDGTQVLSDGGDSNSGAPAGLLIHTFKEHSLPVYAAHRPFSSVFPRWEAGAFWQC